MAKDEHRTQDEKRDPKGSRKPYAAPRLIRYGDVRDLTLGAGTTSNEGKVMNQRKA